MVYNAKDHQKTSTRFSNENVRICEWDDVVAFLHMLPFEQFQRQWIPVLMELWTIDPDSFAANHVKLSLALSYVRDRYRVEMKTSSECQQREAQLRMKTIQKVMNTRPSARLVGAPIVLDDAVKEIVGGVE